MQLTSKLSIALMVGGLAMAAEARSPAEERGYKLCADRFETELRHQRPVVSPVYYVSSDVDTRSYYLNATAWEAGAREPMRAECVTPLRGLRVLAITVEPGRFSNVPRGRVEIEVATD